MLASADLGVLAAGDMRALRCAAGNSGRAGKHEVRRSEFALCLAVSLDGEVLRFDGLEGVALIGAAALRFVVLRCCGDLLQ